MSSLRVAAAAALLISAVVGCGGSDEEVVTGIVVEVEGDLTTVEYFDLVLPDARRLRFFPAPEVLFHDRAPLTHLRDHLRSGELVEVRFERLDDGTLTAVAVEDR